MDEKTVVHPIAPTFDDQSEILILGSFPSVKSRESAYFYGHPQNRFWRVLAAVYGEKTPETNEEKKAFLLRRRIAVWDVIASCTIEGSADGSIRDVRPNDLSAILARAPIRKVFLNGRTAERLYRKYMLPQIGLPFVCLPSTSPANAAWSLDALIAVWRAVAGETARGTPGKAPEKAPEKAGGESS